MAQALRAEIDRNQEIARSMQRLLDQERDMLQGDARQRLVLSRFHTDVWDATVNAGNDVAQDEAVATCYRRLKEANAVIDRFQEYGDAIMHTPLVPAQGKPYSRDNVLDILQEVLAETEEQLRAARTVVADDSAISTGSSQI